jgi:alpha-L-rhamnosidase
MSVTIGIDAEREYQVALNFVDWNKNGCRQAVEMMDAGTLNQVAPVKIVDDFSGGAYLVYQYNKSAKFRINKVRGSLVTLSGIFFDPAATTSTSH